MYQHIAENDMARKFLEEPIHIAAQREQLNSQLKVLKNALKILKRDSY
jgi:hypothetical protein